MPVQTRMMSLIHHPGWLFPTWNHAFSDFDTLFRRHSPMNEGLNLAPFFDARENKYNYFLEADMPGVAKKDINVQFADHNTIRISGYSERSTSSKDTENPWLRSERMVFYPSRFTRLGSLLLWSILRWSKGGIGASGAFTILPFCSVSISFYFLFLLDSILRGKNGRLGESRLVMFAKLLTSNLEEVCTYLDRCFNTSGLNQISWLWLFFVVFIL